MATVKPRITVTLSPAAHLALKRLGELTSQSQSAMVGELVESSLPVFLRVIQVMEAANRAKDSVTTDMRDSLHRAQERIEGHLAQVLDHMEEGYAPILAIDQEAATRTVEAAPPTSVGGAASTVPEGSSGPAVGVGVAAKGKSRRPPGKGRVDAAVSGGLAESTPVPVTRGSGPPKSPSRGGAERKAAALKPTGTGVSDGAL